MNCESWLRPKKSRMTADSALGLISFCGDIFDALIEQRHALLDEAFGAGQADAALVGEQFAHRAHAAAAQVVNVVQRCLRPF
jgi:hypothetical protein